MNEKFFKDFSSALDIISQLEMKYKEKATIGSKSRFPASLVFFSSKKQYKQFLEQAHWTNFKMSNFFIGDQIPSEHKIKQWFDKALDESKKKPLIITPMTEFIRIYQSQEFSLIITKIVQSQGSQIIIPMLDFFEKYQQFIKSFIHKERMAEVFVQDESNIEDDREIELIFDKTGQVVIDAADIVKSPKDWILLWETGDIAVKNTLLIQNSTIVNIVEKADISVPKIKKIPIHSIKDYLQYEYSINPSVFQLEPNPAILDYIRSKEIQVHGPNFWNSLEKTIFSDLIDFEDQIFNYWENNQKEESKIFRWFWLNKAKSTKLNIKILEDLVQTLDDPEKLLDQLYFSGLEKVNIDQQILKDRREIFSHISNPFFFNDSSTLENIVNKMLEIVGNNPHLIIERMIGIFEFEQKIIVNIVPKLMTPEFELSKNHFLIIKQIWPEYAYYIEPSLYHRPVQKFDLTKEFSKFAHIYREYYLLSKVMFDNPLEELEALQKEFRKQWDDIIAAKNLDKIESCSSKKLISELKDKKYIFLDGVGFEWGNLIKYLLEIRGWQVLEIIPILAPLPSITEFFSFSDSAEHTDEFDQYIHKPYKYPDTIQKEIQKLKTIVEINIHNKFKGHTQPIWIISDHGSTAFARKGTPLKYFKDKNAKHGGRYSIYDNELISSTDNIKKISHDSEDFLISTTYDNLGNSNPKGEGHGGGTPEEITAIAIKVLPPAVKIPEQILSVESEKRVYSPLDEFIKIIIKATNQENILDIKMNVNESPQFALEMKYHKQRILTIPITLLKEKGLAVGNNKIQLTINNRETTTFEIKLESGSQMTGFDDKFKF